LNEGVVKKKIQERSADKERRTFLIQEKKFFWERINANKDDKNETRDLELFPFVKDEAKKTLIPPIMVKRIAEK
jgi:methylmalonyl-CoA mutase